MMFPIESQYVTLIIYVYYIRDFDEIIEEGDFMAACERVENEERPEITKVVRLMDKLWQHLDRKFAPGNNRG